jgi:hypothetical protein
MAIGFLVLLCSVPVACFAGLGGKAASVSDDQSRLQASVKVTSRGLYQVHELRTPSGNVVREFVSPSGNVFGVAWTGRRIPDYSQLLGSYADHITKAAQSRRDHRAPLTISEPEFVFSSFGHMRFYSGRAYIPGLMPSGVSPQEVK